MRPVSITAPARPLSGFGSVLVLAHVVNEPRTSKVLA